MRILMRIIWVRGVEGKENLLNINFRRVLVIFVSGWGEGLRF
jgi:hypothetical protein